MNQPAAWPASATVRILIVAPNWFGDTILSLRLFPALRQRLPAAIMDVLVAGWTAPVLRRMPEINQVIQTDFRHGQLRLRDRWRLGRQLRANHYRQAVVLPNTF